jgi:hypothetical protein
MINVTLITNDGAGLPQQVDVADDTRLEDFLRVAFEGDIEEFKIRVRANGTSVEAHMDYILQDGDRISLAPLKVDGSDTVTIQAMH